VVSSVETGQGQNQTPANQRRHSKEYVATILAKSEAPALDAAPVEWLRPSIFHLKSGIAAS
jgi:hypothetical protein